MKIIYITLIVLLMLGCKNGYRIRQKVEVKSNKDNICEITTSINFLKHYERFGDRIYTKFLETSCEKENMKEMANTEFRLNQIENKESS